MIGQTLKLDNFIPYRLSVAANAASAVIAMSYQRRFGISIPEWRVIAILGEGVPLAPRAIVERARLDKVSVSRAAKELESRGLIVRFSDRQDQRSHRLTLTGAGCTLYEAVAPEALALEDRLLAGFADWERGALEGLLRKFEDAATNFE